MTEYMDPAVRAAVLRAEQQKIVEPSDPAIREALRRAAEREREAGRRVAEGDRQRQQAARDELAARKDREREVFMAAGGDPADFDRTWSQRVAEIMAEQLRARDRQQQASSVWR